MSTNVEHARPNRTDRPTEDDTETRPSAASTADAPSTTPEPSTTTSPGAASGAAPEPRSADLDSGTDSWTQRCQRQFEPRATDRLANLVDESNLVVISPGDE
ncbi:hypothetical protein [Halobellus rubicundus]|uniref:Uncharacterized protein n=1 Tax=Halobellus rubicundus TaxID=2996466 RepID=A0ABD5MGE0_9EURY